MKVRIKQKENKNEERQATVENNNSKFIPYLYQQQKMAYVGHKRMGQRNKNSKIMCTIYVYSNFLWFVCFWLKDVDPTGLRDQ